MAGDPYELLSQKARHALAAGDHAHARQFYLQALAERTDSPDAHYGLATACFMLNDLETAAFHFKEVTRLDPLRAGAHINLGAVYNRLGQFEEAIKTLRRGIQLDSKRAEAYYNLGLAYRRSGQIELAIQAYREATHLNPRMADAHHNLANLLMEMGRYPQALTHYKQALEILPNFEKAKAGLAQAEAALKPSAPAGRQRAEEAGSVQAKPPADLNRMVDPMAEAPLLAALHQATIDSQHQGRAFLDVLEEEVEPGIKEVSSLLLYAETSSATLSDRVKRFEAALQNMRALQKNLQLSMKKLRESSDQLLEHTHAPSA